MSEQFGDYELIRIVGLGGMGGEIWEARETDTGRKVAIKRLPPKALLDPELAERFRMECLHAASVVHPNVLPVYCVGTGDAPYLAMQFSAGHDLAREIEMCRMIIPERAVSIVEQVAAALAVAHEQKLQHRDVKPANILLQAGARPGSDHAYLIDWGIAKPFTPDYQRLTALGLVVGTAPYIAPERLVKTPDPESDQRADVYSLAAVLYECLTGRPPYSGTESSILQQHRYAEPPALPRRQLSGVPIPRALNAVIRKGLAKQPWDRYETAPELAAAARAALTGGTRWLPRVTTGLGCGSITTLALLGAGMIDRSALGWAVPALSFAGVLLTAAVWPSPPEPPLARPEIRPSDPTRDFPGGGPDIGP